MNQMTASKTRLTGIRTALQNPIAWASAPCSGVDDNSEDESGGNWNIQMKQQ